MPNNCSTLIQRKQNILHKILRSSSDGKLQNAVAETTAQLCVSGTRKTPAYSTSSPTHHVSTAAAGNSNVRRSNLFATNRIQPSSNNLYDVHLPSIRDSHGAHDFASGQRTPLTNNSPKSIGRPPSASISSIFNALTKRSSENFTNTYGDHDELNYSNPVPPSRRSQRPHKMNGANSNLTKQTIVPQKLSGYNEIDIRFSNGSADTNEQQQRVVDITTRYRSNAAQTQMESPIAQNAVTKERTHFGTLYQRRQNNSVKAPSKQKIDKYRRRSEEVTQAMNGSPPTNNGLTSTNPAAGPSMLTRPKLPTTCQIASVRRVSSDGEMQARLDVLRLSMDKNLLQTDQSKKSQSQQQARSSRVKSPYLYSNNQQIKPATPVLNAQIPSVRLRRSRTPTQQGSSANSSQHQNNTNPTDGRSSRQQQQQTVKISANASPGNLYLAFIASRHLSSLEDALLECDIDHQKLLRIFTWLKVVEDHRHEQVDHDQLLIEQNQRMLDEEDDLSLYSEVQNAVDDLPANTAGKPCERIATMQFED